MIRVLILLVALLLPLSAKAQSESQFVTIVNPVRISKYNPTPSLSLAAQYFVISQNDFPATWLFTFDSLSDEKLIQEALEMNNKQEMGIFLEVTPEFAQKSGVEYHERGSWHFANSVFLSGYSIEERKRLIDVVFAKFKEEFGYYPISVGSWWTDSYSMNYMKERYGILNNLGCADQFSTDGYQLWGQYWSIPFYPSKYHPAIPASSVENKLDILNFQWAARDPLQGYKDSTFSTQDYQTRPQQDISYFEKLVVLFTKKSNNRFGQITIGLEADFTPQTYSLEFSKQMLSIKKFQRQGKITPTNMRQFGEWYRLSFPDISPEHTITASDLLGSETESTWYQSPRYRAGFTKTGSQITIRDLRVYYGNQSDPYSHSPNGERILHINLPAILDEVEDGYSWMLPVNAKIETGYDKLTLSGIDSLPSQIHLYPGLEITKSDKSFIISFPANLTDYSTIRGWDSESTYFFKQSKFPLLLLAGRGWHYLQKTNLHVSQDEQIALNKLRTFDGEKVMVNDYHCLQCPWSSPHKPASFANQRNYVGNLADKLVLYQNNLTEVNSREEANKIVKMTGVDYIYLVKYGDYLEYLPFSPGDWGIDLVLENANVQIWKVK